MFWKRPDLRFSIRVFVRTMFCFLPLSIFLFICLVSFFYYHQSHYLHNKQEQGQRDLMKHKMECHYQIEWVTEDILRLTALAKKYFDKNEIIPSDKAEISEFLLYCGQVHRYYDQIRYIDVSGKEVVRINFNENGYSIVPDHLLQNKADRYYFSESLELPEGKIYISPMDLNIENGRIEYPVKPMIRFGTPLYNSSDQLCGIVVLNYNAQLILDMFKHEKMSENDNHNYLIDRNGYLLYGPNPSYLWGFMFEDGQDKVLSHLFRKAGQIVKSKKSGFCKTHEGIFLWDSIDPFDKAFARNPQFVRGKNEDTYYWKIIYHVPRSEVISHVYMDLCILGAVGIVLDAIFLLGSLRLSKLALERKTSFQLLKESEAKARDMAARARDGDQAKSQFMATMSHELRTPLNAILGFSDLLEDGLDDDQKEYLVLIQSAGKKLFKIIEGILDFDKIEKKRLKMDFDDCVIDDLLKQLQLYFMDAAKDKSLEFSISKSSQVPESLYTDQIRLYECLENLLDNAIKFTDKGHVYINVGLQQDETETYVRFDIEDTGVGISKEDQSRIIQSFTQIDSSDSRNYGGVGMGLALTSELVSQLFGEFSFISHIDKGSIFTVMVPLNLKNSLDERLKTLVNQV